MTIASGGGDKTIKLWDLKTCEERSRLLRGTPGKYTLFFSVAKGKTLASGSGGMMIKLWNLNSLSEIKNIQGHKEKCIFYSIQQRCEDYGFRRRRLYNMHTEDSQNLF